MIDDISKPPVSPCKPYPRILEAGDLGDGVDCDARDWVDAGAELQTGEAVGDTFDAEDVQPQRAMTTPELPSREVIEAHRIDHWPYRTWCDECNEGLGRERGHKSVEHRIAMISFDYAFMTRKGPVVDQGEEGWDDPECLKILVVKDSKSGSIFAHGVFRKGVYTLPLYQRGWRGMYPCDTRPNRHSVVLVAWTSRLLGRVYVARVRVKGSQTVLLVVDPVDLACGVPRYLSALRCPKQVVNTFYCFHQFSSMLCADFDLNG